MKYKVGIAGYGIVGKRRRVFIDKHPDLELVAVCDKLAEMEELVGDKVNFYLTYKELLSDNLDIIFVCMTNDIAPEVTKNALSKGLHVFCEKPPGRNVQDIESVIEIEKRTKNQILKYGFNHRYHDSVMMAKEKIDTGDFGEIISLNGVYGKSKIVSFQGGWRSIKEIAGGGILLDQGIHMLDLIRFFAGEFNEIKSFVSNDFWKYEIEDNAYAIMRNKKGVVALINSSATIWEHKFNLRINLSKGFLELSGLLTSSKSYGEEKLYTHEHKDSNSVDNFKKIEYKFMEDNSWEREIDEFVNCIKMKKEPIYGTSLDALETMKLVYGIYENDKSYDGKI